MAYLDDDFQAYAIGANVPFGSWTLDPGAFTKQIVAGGSIIPTTTRSLLIQLGTVAYDRTTAACLKTFSQYCAFIQNSVNQVQPTFAFTNGPNGGGQSFTLLQLRIEPDGTMTATCPVSGQILGNSGDIIAPFYAWNFAQINVTFSDVLNAGVLCVNIQCQVALNEKLVLNFNTTTTIAVAQLANATAEVNRFQLTGGQYGAYTLDVLTAIATDPHAGTPNAIAYQAAVEVDVLPDSGKLIAYQAAIEVDELPSSAQLVVNQMVIEVDILERSRWYISES